MSVAGDESLRVHLQCVHSCEACLDLAEPIPLQVKQQLMSPDLKARLGHGYVAIDSIRETHHPVRCLGSPPPNDVITALEILPVIQSYMQI